MVRKRKNIDTKIIIGYTKLRISLPIFFAKNEGLFKHFGLSNVELKQYDTAELLTEAINQGEVFLGGYIALPISLKSISSTGISLQFVGGVFEDNNHKISYFIKRKGLDISDITDLNSLKNIKIGYFPTVAYKLWLKSLLWYNNINDDHITLIPVNVSDQYNYLKIKEIDFLLTNDPIATKILIDNVGDELLPDKSLIPDAIDKYPLYYGSFNILKDYSDSNKEIVKRISLALNKAVSLIQKIDIENGSVYVQLKEYLHYENEVLKRLPIGNFKKTNEVDNEQLNSIKEYYHSQFLYRKKISTKNLQFRLRNKFENLEIIFDKYSILYNKYKAIFAPLGIILGGLLTFLVTYYSTQKNINVQVKQFQEQLIQERKSIPAQFIIKFEDVGLPSERTYLINIGYSTLIRVSADLDYYFITKDDKVYLASILYKSVNDTILIKKILSHKQIHKLQDLKIMLNTYRPVSTNDILKPYEGNNLNQIIIGNKNNISFNNSSSIIKNLKIVDSLMQSKLIARWKIEYFEEISREKKTVYKYYLFTDNEMLLDKFETKRIDLERIIGGKRIIKMIEDYENNTKNIIFE